MTGRDQLETLVESVIELTFKNTFHLRNATKAEKINYVIGKCMNITRGKVDPEAIRFFAERLIAE